MNLERNCKMFKLYIKKFIVMIFIATLMSAIINIIDNLTGYQIPKIYHVHDILCIAYGYFICILMSKYFLKIS